MNLSHLRYFVTLAKVKHYTKAAKELHITQPSLSHAIHTLERELGVQLFEKQKNNTDLTCCGKAFLQAARQSLALLDNGVDLLTHLHDSEGLVRLGCLRYLGIDYIPKLLKAYKRDGHEKITFTIDSGLTPQLIQDLSEQKTDIVFASKPIDSRGLTCVPVAKQDLVLIVPKGHPLAKECTINLQDTAPYPYVFFDKTAGLRSVISDIFDRCQMKPTIAYEVSEDEVIAGMVAQGFGIAVVPYMPLLLHLDVKILPITYPQYDRLFFMITNSTAYMAPAVAEFRNYVLQHSVLPNHV